MMETFTYDETTTIMDALESACLDAQGAFDDPEENQP